MGERNALVLAALVVATIGAVPVAGLAATSDQVAQTNNSTAADSVTVNETNASVAPGERLAGVMNVQKAELQGEIDERSFGISVANATSDRNRADIVNRQLEEIEGRLDELQERKQELRDARENESISAISEGRYRAELSEVVAETETAKRLANRSESVSKDLPTDVLNATGIDVTAIQTLQDRAANLTGPEVAEIARSIAGPGIGGPPADRGPDERPERPKQGGPEERPGGPDRDTTDGQRPSDESQQTDNEQTRTPRSG